MKISKSLVFLFSFLLLFALVFFYLYSNDLFSIEKIRVLVDSSGFWGPLVFALLYILITTFGISAAAFTILAGSLFGTLMGLIVVVISATISATLAFFIARYFREKLLLKEKKNKSEKKGRLSSLIKRIEKNADERGFITLVILRLAFLPYIPLSYASGLVRKLRAFDFIAATFITNIFGSFVFIYLGDKLEDLFMGHVDLQTIVSLIIAIVLLVLFVRYVPRVAQSFEKKKEIKNEKRNGL